MSVLRLLPLVLLPLALAACDEAAMKDLRLPWDKEAVAEAPAVTGPPAVSPLVEPVELPGAPQVAVATADARTLHETAFAAEGPGGAWRVEVAGDKARFMRAGARDATVQVRRLVYARGVEYVGQLGGTPFALTVLGANCETPGMGRGWPLSARVKSGGKTVEGCAAPAASAPARAQPAPTQPAPAQPAPAKPAAAKPASTAATAPAPAAPQG